MKLAYQNMKAEMNRYSIQQSQVADPLGMSTNNVSLKINERIPMTVEKAKEIQQKFLPHANLDYLLASDGDVPTKRQRADAAVESFIERSFEHEDDPLRSMEADEPRAKARAIGPEHVINVIGQEEQ